MEKGFADYYTAQKKNYTFKVKIAKCDLTEEDKANIQCCFEKYNIVSQGAFKKTPLQENPLDFPSVKNTEVHIFDITVEYPMTPDALRREVADAIGLTQGYVSVYGKNDPREQYTADINARASEDFKKDYKAAIGSVPEDEDRSDLHTSSQKDSLLKKFEADRKDRKGLKYETNDLIVAQKTDDVGVAKKQDGEVGTKSVLSSIKHTKVGKL
jgi:hypothetical protein